MAASNKSNHSGLFELAAVLLCCFSMCLSVVVTFGRLLVVSLLATSRFRAIKPP